MIELKKAKSVCENALKINDFDKLSKRRDMILKAVKNCQIYNEINVEKISNIEMNVDFNESLSQVF